MEGLVDRTWKLLIVAGLAGACVPDGLMPADGSPGRVYRSASVDCDGSEKASPLCADYDVDDECRGVTDGTQACTNCYESDDGTRWCNQGECWANGCVDDHDPRNGPLPLFPDDWEFEWFCEVDACE